MLNSPIVNAFALPSGDIFVTRGLLALADDTSEIAAVMAHEIGHITAHHAAQRAEFEKTAALFTRVNSQVLAHYEAQDEAEARSKLAIARFSRQQEFEADQIGIKTIARAGYDPYGAARFLTALGEWSALRASVAGAGSADRPDMTATHPSTPERVAQAVAEARQFGEPGTGETGRNAYLNAIDGLAFGDDPSQGVVRDNLFIHPRLGFAFEAPEGFTLDNQSAALIGVGEAGGEALRLDSIPIADSATAASAIGSGWIDGVKTTSIEAKQIAGLEAATAVAQGEQWSFRLGAVRLNGRLYRLIFAAHTLSPAVNSRFMASLNSFHLLNAQELGACRRAEDQDRRGGERRHAGNARRTDGFPAAIDRSVLDPQRPRAGRRPRPRAALQDRRPVSPKVPGAGEHARFAGRLLVATHNAGKLWEIRELLKSYDVDPVDAKALNIDEPEETGLTFRDNAALKAQAATRACGLVALADDSGLCVEALGGAPGVYSARWAGEPRDFAAAMARVEREVRALGAPPPWRASFVSVMALAWPDGAVETFEGRIDGDLVFPPRGTAGFGYDPIFRPEGHTRTFGEMMAAEKNALPADGSPALSHRARAFQKLARERLIFAAGRDISLGVRRETGKE